MKILALAYSHAIDQLKKKFFQVGELTQLFTESVYCCFTRPFYWPRLVEQVEKFGIGSLSITIIIGLVMGSVMTLNFGHGLAKFGGTLYVPAMVNLSIFREMAPVFTSLLIAGRIGSGMASELGSMKVSQQIDAMRALGTSPVRALVVPRLIAAMICLPLLTGLSDVLGLLGGMVISLHEFQMPPSLYLNKVFIAIKFHDFFSGLFKTWVFSIIITIVACYRGLRTREGTRGVGESTTWVVVVTSLCILISDFFLSKIVLLFWIN